MTKKIDGVVEAVRYAPDGMIVSVRLYERRGSTFSDRVLLSRDEFVKRLQSGKLFVTGQRKEFLASSFETGASVHLQQVDGQPKIFSGNAPVHQDHLDGVPVF